MLEVSVFCNCFFRKSLALLFVVMSLSLVGLRAQVVVHGDVYGGGAFADVGTEGDASKTTTVTILAGRVEGNVYGGALGDATHEPNVYGKVNVSIGQNVEGVVSGSASFGTIDAETGVVTHGNVFGGNNANGTPKDSVTIDIWSTAPTTSDQVGSFATDADFAAYLATAEAHQPTSFAIQNLYGGSNVAHYVPAAGKGTRVHIHQCNNTVKMVYGGGRAAAVGCTTTVASARVVVDGGRIDTLFAGGDGHTTDANGALIPADIYGDVSAYVRGGHYSAVFGASNSSGTITGTRSVTIDRSGPCEEQPERVGALFGGGNLADASGSVSLEVDCGTGYFHEVYGGSNLANIGTKAEFLDSNPSDVTLTIRGGTYDFVYGGSKGRRADNSNPSNPIAAKAADICGNVTLNIYGGQIGSAFGGSNINGNILGTVTVNVNWSQPTDCDDGKSLDFVYGGSNLAQYKPADSTITSPVVNLINGTVNHDVFGGGKGSATDVNDGLVKSNPSVSMTEANFRVSGCIYGGGELASVGTYTRNDDFKPTSCTANTGNPVINITAGTVGPSDEAGTSYDHGHVYGGGKGIADLTNSLVHNLAFTNHSNVIISGSAVIKGNVYGGGENGYVLDSTLITISSTTGGEIRGTVFGGGKGAQTDELLGQVYGNAHVDMTGGYIWRSIYGGGEIASVGTFTDYYEAKTSKHIVGEPKTCSPTTGRTMIIVTGGEVGKNNTTMPDPSDPPEGDDMGYIFGGCRGEMDSITYPKANLLAMCRKAHVEVKGSALVTASVYGGPENGQVLEDTYVLIDGQCQIGTGHYETTGEGGAIVHHFDDKYSEALWDAAIDAVKDGTIETAEYESTLIFSQFHECDHLAYGVPDGSGGTIYPVYDVYADRYESNGGSQLGGDGHSFFGNVFAGGSGYYAMWDVENVVTHWRPSAGRVNGNTTLEIKGGHILTSVYGGNEMSDVGGKCTVLMSGGTLGVPRSVSDCMAHPVTCYLFGAGMGDQRTQFNQWTNVGSVEVSVTGGTIFGSVFGGGEDGHVLGDVVVNIKNTVADADYAAAHSGISEGDVIASPFIGTQGLSYVDGNVFGGGRGFSGTALTAGAVCGNVTVNIEGGTLLGSVYGGGRLASVGIGLEPPTIVNPDDPTETIHNPAYGALLADDGTDDPATAGIDESLNHGHVYVNISNCTIGNAAPYAFFSDATKNPRLVNTIFLGEVPYYRGLLDALSEGTKLNILQHTISGNVFGGSMGRTTTIQGTISPIWPNLAKVKSTTVTIGEGALVRSSVYGGGEMGSVMEDSRVYVTGGTVGSEVMASGEADVEELKQELRMLFGSTMSDVSNHYHYGCVFGGGYGSMSYTENSDLEYTYTHQLTDNNAPVTLPDVELAGRVYGNTTVSITGGRVLMNVHGGGEMASVGTSVYGSDGDMTAYVANTGNCTVSVSGTGMVGPLDMTGYNGYVYGGGKGMDIDFAENFKKYCNVNNTQVTVNGGQIRGSIFGGGADSHVWGDAEVSLLDGTLGTEGVTSWDGNIFGGGRNYLHSNLTNGRVGGNITVNMSGGIALGNIYGGGRMGQAGVDVDGNMQPDDGTDDPATVGIDESKNHGYVTVNISGGTVGNNNTFTYDEDNINPVIGDYPGFNGMQMIEIFTGYSMGNVYGGGRGYFEQYDEAVTTRFTAKQGLLFGLVKNTEVNIWQASESNPTHVYGIVLGGGEIANVGSYDVTENSSHQVTGITVAEGTGRSKVTISGGTIGDDRAKMRSTLQSTADDDNFWLLFNDDLGYVYGGGEGYSDAPSNYVTVPVVINSDGSYSAAGEGAGTSLLDLLATVQSTEVEITGTAVVKASVFGGAESGHVMGNTKVTISGGQVGVGNGPSADVVYDESVFINPATTPVTDANSQYPTERWVFGESKTVEGETVTIYTPFDPVELKAGNKPSDGKSWFGNVFGGGSGWFPYVLSENKGTSEDPDYEYVTHWENNSGKVWGNTEVLITGGHIINNVYGANEATDVGGKATVRISGGTVGVPRSQSNVLLSPFAGNVFGGGCGDARDICNSYNNVSSTEVEITGGFIYGSVLGGAEDGRVLGNTKVTVGQASGKTTVIGSTGCSSLDGNVYGGGCNYFGSNEYAGRVGGNSEVYVTGGTVLGNIYGGGRNGQTGVDATVDLSEYITSASPYTSEGLDSINHGLVTVTVTGGTIGNPDATLRAANSTATGNVFGGGKGSTEHSWHARSMNTIVTVANSNDGSTVPLIYHNVYGGGELASVGYVSNWGEPYTDSNSNFSFSRPYKPVYVERTGTTQVNIFGGRIGTTGSDNGDVFGGGKGQAGNRYDMAIIGNVRQSYVDVNYAADLTDAQVADIKTTTTESPCIAGSLYGGSENGHVYGDVRLKLRKGFVGHSVYGGGKGKGKYNQWLVKSTSLDWDDVKDLDKAANPDKWERRDIYDICAGRVYGNTWVTMTGGHVGRNIYGGGNMGSVGVGNYAGHSGDYYPTGYGERTLGDASSADWAEVLSSGTCHVTVTGGTVGTSPYSLHDEDNGDVFVVGSVFGACRGTAVPNISGAVSPRFYYLPEFFYAYVNNAVVTIGSQGQADADAPTIYGSVYGGGEDGHVRLNTEVNVWSGKIGVEKSTANEAAAGEATTAFINDKFSSLTEAEKNAKIDEVNEIQWNERGNVFGAGSGYGMYDSDGDGIADSYSTSSGSVTCSTTVNYHGGTIYQSVYGGGNLGTIGPPEINGTLQPEHTMVTVNIYATVAQPSAEPEPYGGYVFGSSRGMAQNNADWTATPRKFENYATCAYTRVNHYNGIVRTIYGGGQNGQVSHDTEVNLIQQSGGNANVRRSIYGGGKGVQNETGYESDVIAGRVKGNTTVNILHGTVGSDYANNMANNWGVYGGCRGANLDGNTYVNIGNESGGDATVMGPVFGANNLAGTVGGNTNVHIWHTKHTSGDGITSGNGYPVTLKNIHDDGETGTKDDILDAQDIKGLSETQATAFASPDRFALKAVYGGGNRASHLPTADDGTTLVHVHFCDENTIRDLYGGGNAADTKNNSIIIDGGRIYRVFGGGNGYSATGNHDNPDAPNYNPGANVIGEGTALAPSGTATTKIHGGLITKLFGGSNQKGNLGAIVLNIDNELEGESDACEELLVETFGEGNEAEGGGGEVTIGCGARGVDFYGGANNADITGDIILNVEGGVFTNVFGGSKGTPNNPADINGSVTVNFRGGSVENLFGGSDSNGNITGKITVNVDFDSRYTCDGQTLDFVYGAGRNAAYTPTDGTLLSPEVNIMRGRVNYDVFGGGLGATAVVMGNPKVTVGNLPSGVTEESPERSDYRPEVGRNVYGGGNEAAVGVMNDADKKRNTQVWITGFTRILGNVYGGGNQAPVSGDTQVVVK